MSDDWTPTTEDVRGAFTGPGGIESRAAAFDRWLADMQSERDVARARLTEALATIETLEVEAEQLRATGGRVVAQVYNLVREQDALTDELGRQAAEATHWENIAEAERERADALAAVIERVRDVTATAIDEADGDEIVLDALGPAWGALDAAPADLLADHDRETRARAFEDAAIIAASVEGVNPDARRVIARALNEQAEKAKGGGDQ